jgi:hypothetical protein
VANDKDGREMFLGDCKRHRITDLVAKTKMKTISFYEATSWLSEVK